MFYKLLYLIGGISSIGLGYKVLTQGGWWSVKSEAYISFGNAKTPVGILAIVIGGLLCINAIFGKWRKKNPLICPKCDEIIEYSPAKEMHCVMCGTEMEELKGFYERHPKRKNK